VNGFPHPVVFDDVVLENIQDYVLEVDQFVMRALGDRNDDAVVFAPLATRNVLSHLAPDSPVAHGIIHPRHDGHFITRGFGLRKAFLRRVFSIANFYEMPVHLIGERVKTLRDLISLWSELTLPPLTYSAGEAPVTTELIDASHVEILLNMFDNIRQPLNPLPVNGDYFIKVRFRNTVYRVWKIGKPVVKSVKLRGESFSASMLLQLLSFTDGFVTPETFEGRHDVIYVGYYSLSNVDNKRLNWSRFLPHVIYTRPNVKLLKLIFKDGLSGSPPWSVYKYELKREVLCTTVKGELFIDYLPMFDDGEITFPLRSFCQTDELHLGTMQVMLTEVAMRGIDIATSSSPFNTPFAAFSLMLGILWMNRACQFADRYEYRRLFLANYGIRSGIVNGVEYDAVFPDAGVGCNVSGHGMSLGAALFTGLTSGVNRYLAYIGSNILDDGFQARRIVYYDDMSAPIVSKLSGAYLDPREFRELGTAEPGTLWHSPMEYYLGFLYAAHSISTLEPQLATSISPELAHIRHILLIFDEYKPRRVSENASLGMMRSLLRHFHQ
jgi:hypothetical protein